MRQVGRVTTNDKWVPTRCPSHSSQVLPRYKYQVIALPQCSAVRHTALATARTFLGPPLYCIFLSHVYLEFQTRRALTSLSKTEMVRFSASITMGSLSLSSAIVPPSCASGVMWPMMNLQPYHPGQNKTSAWIWNTIPRHRRVLSLGMPIEDSSRSPTKQIYLHPVIQV